MKVSSVYVMLGDKCNFSCVYCMQKEKFSEMIPLEIDHKVIKYINDLELKKSFSRTAIDYNDKILLQFYGGEPLLYFKTIEYIVENLERKKFDLNIISNGSLLTDKMVDFMNLYKINFTLSNDGKNTAKFRGKNVLDDKRFNERFLKINSKSVSCVLSALNYELLEIWDYFDKTLPENIPTNYDWVMDTGHLNRPLCKFNFERLYKYLVNVFTVLKKKYLEESITNNEVRFLLPLLSAIDRHKNTVGKKRCSTVEGMLNIDIRGNIYLCHNSGNILGTIDSCYDDILLKFKKYNKYAKSIKCLTCIANPICKSGCILVGEQARDMYYCKMWQTIMKSLIAGFSLGLGGLIDGN